MFDPQTGEAITEGYPRDILKWGVPNNIEGALLRNNGETYFFKDGLYWKFDDMLKTVDLLVYPRKTTEWWFGCNDGMAAGIVDILSVW